MTNAVVKREAAPAAVQGGKVDFCEVLADCDGLADGRVAERVRGHLANAAFFSRVSLAHAIAAGWLLRYQKIHTTYGAWQSWCRDELGVSHKTADRYIGLFEASVGAARKRDGIPFDNFVTERELDFATVGMEDKSVTRAMVELGVVKRNKDWGGRRNERAEENGKTVGRPAKDPAAEVAAAASDPDLNWAEVSGYLKGLYDFALDGDGFGTLADDDLETVVVMLGECEARAKALLAARRENGGSAEAVSRIRAELAPDVPCVRADKDGYCTGPCEGSICVRCSEYRPVGRGL